MKLKSIYLVSMALLAGVFAACNDNDVENFDNQVYINGSAMTSTVLLKNTVSDTEGSFRISMARPESQDITAGKLLYGRNSAGYHFGRCCHFRRHHCQLQELDGAGP